MQKAEATLPGSYEQAAACLALALTACGQQKEAPATVGTIGSVDIPGGVYQLAQFSAYAEADSLTSEDNVLKAKLNMDGETGLHCRQNAGGAGALRRRDHPL